MYWLLYVLVSSPSQEKIQLLKILLCDLQMCIGGAKVENMFYFPFNKN